MAIKDKHGIFIVEDTACAIGSEFKGVKVGNWADISVFSLHPRKFITTGEGGIITTNNAQFARWIESYKHFGMGASSSRAGTAFIRIGTNYKLSNVLAAIGLVQMQHIEELLARRIALSENYISQIKHTPGIILPLTTAGGKHSRQSFCIYVDDRDRIMNKIRESGIEVQIGTYALHMHQAFSERLNIIHHGSFSGSRYAYDHCLTLPLYHDLSWEEQDTVIQYLLREI
jgi:perosamine synthetase